MFDICLEPPCTAMAAMVNFDRLAAATISAWPGPGGQGRSHAAQHQLGLVEAPTEPDQPGGKRLGHRAHAGGGSPQRRHRSGRDERPDPPSAPRAGGLPNGEPVAHHGSVVTNTRDEIVQAIED
jgi:hypothetical protein